MALADYDPHELARTRALQTSHDVREANLATMRRWGETNLLKVTAQGPDRVTCQGYITLRQALVGLTPRRMESMLGLRNGQLADGAKIYQLNRLPELNEFEPRGYTTLVDGARLKDGLRQDSDGYRPGEGAFQVELTAPVPVTLLRCLGYDEPFEPGIHPSLRHLYPQKRA